MVNACMSVIVPAAKNETAIAATGEPLRKIYASSQPKPSVLATFETFKMRMISPPYTFAPCFSSWSARMKASSPTIMSSSLGSQRGKIVSAPLAAALGST